MAGQQPVAIVLEKHQLKLDSMADELIAAFAKEAGLRPRDRARVVLRFKLSLPQRGRRGRRARSRGNDDGDGDEERSVPPDALLGRFAWRHTAANNALTAVLGTARRHTRLK
jgi:hypothetical protein